MGESGETPRSSRGLSPDGPDSGVGGPRRREADRLRAARRLRAAEDLDRLGGAVARRADEPRWATSWARSSTSREQIAAQLNRAVEGFGWVLHDRHVAHTAVRISHVVVVPTGVWLIDSLDDAGTVQRWEGQGEQGHEQRLHVGGLDRTAAVEQFGRRSRAVRDGVGDDVPVNAMLVLPHGEFRLLSRAFQVRGVWCSSPRDMEKRVSRRGPLRPPVMERLTWLLAAELPSGG